MVRFSLRISEPLAKTVIKRRIAIEYFNTVHSFELTCLSFGIDSLTLPAFSLQEALQHPIDYITPRPIRTELASVMRVAS